MGNTEPTDPTDIRMQGLRSAMMRAARARHSATGAWEGPGEAAPTVLEFAVQYGDGQTFHIVIQEGSCPAVHG